MPISVRVVTILLAVLLSGCASNSPTERAADEKPIQISIQIAGTADSPAAGWTLSCDPISGDWPAKHQACQRLSESVLAPIIVETQDYGPVTPREVRVMGIAYSRPVNLVFPAYGSSTRRQRFQALAQALGSQYFTADGG